jgi:hypothetical protein
MIYEKLHWMVAGRGGGGVFWMNEPLTKLKWTLGLYIATPVDVLVLIQMGNITNFLNFQITMPFM